MAESEARKIAEKLTEWDQSFIARRTKMMLIEDGIRDFARVVAEKIKVQFPATDSQLARFRKGGMIKAIEIMLSAAGVDGGEDGKETS